MFAIINKIFDVEYPNHQISFPNYHFILQKSLDHLKIDKYNKIIPKCYQRKQEEANMIWTALQNMLTGKK